MKTASLLRFLLTSSRWNFAIFLIALLTIFAITDSSSEESVRNQPARIVRLRGRVQVFTPGATTWRPAHERETIHPGTRVATESGATVLLELSRRNTMQLGEGTEISLDTAAVFAKGNERGDALRYQVSQASGRVLTSLRGFRQGSMFELRAKDATARASTRGTIFLSVIQNSSSGRGDPVVDFYVVSGTITATGPELPSDATLKAGELIRIGEGTGEIELIDEKMLDQFRRDEADPKLDELRIKDCL